MTINYQLGDLDARGALIPVRPRPRRLHFRPSFVMCRPTPAPGAGLPLRSPVRRSSLPLVSNFQAIHRQAGTRGHAVQLHPQQCRDASDEPGAGDGFAKSWDAISSTTEYTIY